MKKICVIGLGYIGLPTASILANNGYDVLGIDINDKVIEKLKNGSPHIEEPDLKGIFISAIDSGKLRVSKKIEKSDVFIISVSTPLTGENEADLSYVESASEEISKYIEKSNLVILESTSPPNTTEELVGGIILKNSGLEPGIDYFLSFCPERVLPGKIIYELINNSRIIGGINEESAIKAKEIYSSFVKGNIYLTDLKTAEFVKLAENTYRDVNLAFSNELSLICSDYHINIWDVLKFANMHPRVDILNPGPGVGGHCIPIDPWFILQNIKRRDTLIERCRKINREMPVIIAGKIIELIKHKPHPKATLFGASYKENIGDTRESPALSIIEELKNKKIKVSVYDPLVESFKYELSNLKDSLKNSDVLVLLAGHNLYNNIDLKYISELMRTKNIFDTRNFFDKEKITGFGFKYFSI
ncbi:UDP-N-acetyl-D-mannosamine dehydrogenase [subsurface metagenome]|nr:nucleotide sugar dehydrogenase [Clostridia bacterium]